MAKKDPKKRKHSFTIAMSFFEQGAVNFISAQLGMSRSEYVLRSVLKSMKGDYQPIFDKISLGNAIEPKLDEAMTAAVFLLILDKIQEGLDNLNKKHYDYSTGLNLEEMINLIEEDNTTMKK